MKAIKPTVGRRVYFYVSAQHYLDSISGDGAVSHNAQPFDAGVLFVHSDREVNLMVTDGVGEQRFYGGVKLVQPGDPEPNGMHCRWMPYQVREAGAGEAGEKLSVLELPISINQMRIETVAEVDKARDAGALMKEALDEPTDNPSPPPIDNPGEPL